MFILKIGNIKKGLTHLVSVGGDGGVDGVRIARNDITEMRVSFYKGIRRVCMVDDDIDSDRQKREDVGITNKRGVNPDVVSYVEVNCGTSLHVGKQVEFCTSFSL